MNDDLEEEENESNVNNLSSFLLPTLSIMLFLSLDCQLQLLHLALLLVYTGDMRQGRQWLIKRVRVPIERIRQLLGDYVKNNM